MTNRQHAALKRRVTRKIEREAVAASGMAAFALATALLEGLVSRGLLRREEASGIVSLAYAGVWEKQPETVSAKKLLELQLGPYAPSAAARH